MNIANADAWLHFEETTFDKSLGLQFATIHSQKGVQERKHEMQQDRIEASEVTLGRAWDDYIKKREEKGFFCCGKVEETTMNRCMCSFVTRKGMNAHIGKGDCRFPAMDLKTKLHKMHLSGMFALSLATGSMTNRYNDPNSKGEVVVNEGNADVRVHEEVRSSWCEPGCYRKPESKNTSVSKSLIQDLDFLFMQGFQTDGPKQGTNKYTAEQARAYLLNLFIDGGRRKYSHDPNNKNGPIPSCQYIKSWFSRRKKKMADTEIRKKARSQQINSADNDEEDLGVLDDYQRWNMNKLKGEVANRMGTKFSKKNFLIETLQLDDKLKSEEPRGYACTTTALSASCCDRFLPSSPQKKESLISFLRLDDRWRHMVEEGAKLSLSVHDTNRLASYHSTQGIEKEK